MSVSFWSRNGKLPSAGSWARWAGAGAGAVLDLVLPAVCVGCRRELAAPSVRTTACRFCDDCVDQLELFAGPTCRQCGAEVPGAAAGQDRCVRCRGRRLWFDETIALGEYKGRLRHWLLAMKSSDGNDTSLGVGELTWHYCRERLEALRPDVVVAVPMHWRRRWSHKTNSAALLAEVLAARLRVRLRGGLLRRRRNTPPQFSLPPSKRWPNVRRAFSAKRSYLIPGAHVLLVDDIMTTGATCSEAARTLKEAGAGRVSVVVAARTLAH
jgi:predicted amidophosphoribosyltransferase